MTLKIDYGANRLPEKVEDRDPIDFVERWLQEVFGKKAFTSLYALDRAHRIPTRLLPPGHPSHPILAWMLHYRDQEIILHLAQKR